MVSDDVISFGVGSSQYSAKLVDFKGTFIYCHNVLALVQKGVCRMTVLEN